jgi:hypothetical protein
METKNQTAVEWLQKQLSNKIYTSIEDYNTQSKLAFDQAKAIEKQQIIDAYFAGYNYEGGRTEEKAEQYYTETFNP